MTNSALDKRSDDYMPWRDQTVLDIVGDNIYHDNLEEQKMTTCTCTNATANPDCPMHKGALDNPGEPKPTDPRTYKLGGLQRPVSATRPGEAKSLSAVPSKPDTKVELEARLIELDILEQYMNKHGDTAPSWTDLGRYKIARLNDLLERLDSKLLLPDDEVTTAASPDLEPAKTEPERYGTPNIRELLWKFGIWDDLTHDQHVELEALITKTVLAELEGLLMGAYPAPEDKILERIDYYQSLKGEL